MKWYRILAIIKRHLLLGFRGPDHFANVIYWPLISIATWGITGIWFQEKAQAANLAAALLLGVCLWQIVVRVNIATAKAVFEELASHNIVNLFSTPLLFAEWVIAIMLLGMLDTLLVLCSSSVFVYMLYKINFFMLGTSMIPLILTLLLSGWCIGFILCSLFIYWGRKMQELMYIVVWGFAPFCAVYYPLAVLPGWVQTIAKFLPMTYAFEAMRKYILQGTSAPLLIGISFALNVLYFAGALLLFRFMFHKSKIKGLARLE